MKITTSLLRSKAAGPLPSLEYLDLSKLGIVTIERLSNCPKLHTLKLRGNSICELSNLECCSQLWHLDVSNNKVQCLDGLSRFLAIGTLTLSNNDLSWKELVKIRHLHVLNISLHGNPQLEKDPYYRIHVIDCLPNVWMLDGRIITSAERLQVKHFFQDSALTDHPVRHKLGRDWFVPSTMKKIQVNGVFGEKARHLLTKFPINAVHNIDIDQKRLKYLAHNLQEELSVEKKYTKRDFQVLKYRKTFLEDLLDVRPTDRERCNMLLLLLVASLEFIMPTHLVKETLETAKLNRIGKVYTMDLFLLPKDVRCQVVCLLLSAIKVDKDIHEDGGLYDRLYLCLFYTVAELTRLSQSDGQGNLVMLAKMQKIYRDYKCLLASEIVQLMCIVPVFFEYMEKDVGVMNLVATGTGDRGVIEKINQLAHSFRTEGRDVRFLYEEIAEILLQKVQEQTLNLTNKSPREDIGENILSSQVTRNGKKAKTPVDVSDYHMKGVTSPNFDPPVLQVLTPRKQLGKFPHLGDVVLLGPQTIGKIISLPQPFLSLVAMDAVPVSNGAMVSKLRDQDDHYTYVNMKQLEWDTQFGFWKPLGTVGDRIPEALKMRYTIQSTEDMRKELERRAAIVDQTSRPNSPDSSMFEPPAREPTPLIYTNFSRSDTPADAIKPKSPRPPRPMSSILKDKLDLKLDLSRRVQSAKVVQDRPHVKQTRSAGKLVTSQSAETIGGHQDFAKTMKDKKTVSVVKQILDDTVSLSMDIVDGQEDKDQDSADQLSMNGSTFVQIDGESVSPGKTKSQQRSDPDLQSDDEPELQSLQANTSSSKSPAVSVNGGNSERPNSELPPPAHLDIQMPNVKDGESEQGTAREKGRKVQGKLWKGMTHSVKRPVSGRKSAPMRTSRPFSAVDAYRYFVTTQPMIRPESGYNTDFQRARMEAWKKRASVLTTPSANQPTPPQRPTSPYLPDDLHSSVNPLHIHPANYWLAGGRDLFWESQQKRPKSGHTPGWREGLPENMKVRPKSAVASRTLRRSKAPNVVTPSSLAYEAMLAGYTNQDLPQLPQLSDYQPLSHQLGLPRRLGSPPPGVDDFYAEPVQDTVYR